jgi:hypothetical protein
MPALAEGLPPPPHVPRPGFKAFHKSDRNFVLSFVALCWLGVALGFIPPVTTRFEGHAEYVAPLILKIHMASFLAWMLILSIQIILVRSRNVAVHMSLGLSGFALVPIMAVSALLSEAYSQRFHHKLANESFFIVPIFEILAFTSLASAALLFRKNPAAHKRLIVMATAMIVGAAYGRWWDNALIRILGDGYFGMLGNTYTGCNILLALAVGYDVVTRGRPHRIYWIAVPMILFGEFVTSAVYHWPAWLPVAQMLIGLKGAVG